MSRSSYFWSVGEISDLKKAYQEGGGLQRAVELIPHKSKSTIAAKASRLGITVAKPRRGGFEISSGSSQDTRSNTDVLGRT